MLLARLADAPLITFRDRFTWLALLPESRLREIHPSFKGHDNAGLCDGR